ncbi:hypothetical protein SAMN02745225_00504 [Ferrithrix thermotolerans DSM 19514]|uniref:Uncharacterized protein n=1 Tax=Ferrithrix thermotolerans DSM 19514 TaxID=1121881 RepID=A0A1M4T528_9ACTN|nr:hypothetical protein SAMN02745225_00504 [Ferrithrix thermotolerans DSM 19514]
MVTTIEGPGATYSLDLVEQNFDQGRVSGVVTSDITYLSIGSGFADLCAMNEG